MRKPNTRKISPELKQLEQALAQAECYTDWLELSADHDRLTGGDLWRKQNESRLYDSNSIQIRQKRLRRLRKKGDDEGLLFSLNEGIHGNMTGMGKAQLYQRAKCGTKVLIEDYIGAWARAAYTPWHSQGCI